MSRHRNIRSMNYEDEYEGYDDVYGHSVEDDYCVSPGTVAQFTYDRSEHPLASYVSPSTIKEDEEDDIMDEEPDTSQSDTGAALRHRLNAQETAQLNACLETMRSIVGDSVTEAAMIDAVLTSNYNSEQALNLVLNTQETPKPQRTPRKRPGLGAAAAAIEIPSKASPVRPAAPSDRPPGPPDLALASPSRSSATAPPFSRPPLNDAPATKDKRMFTIGSNAAETQGATPTQSPRPIKRAAELRPPVAPPGDRRKETKTDSTATSTNGTQGWNEYVDVGGDTGGVARDGGAGGGAEGEGSRPGTPRREVLDMSGLTVTPGPLHKSASKARMDRLDVQKELDKRKADGKDFINLVVIGHVDAGKSTLMGHVLFLLGLVNKRTMHRHEQDARKIGKASFAFAWVLDETEEERSRGVTMDIAQTRFETKTKVVTLLDAPGHKDFIPNMITGACQADVAVLVINATKGEFETGFETGGQTREHAMLVRSLGVSQLVVAINKMDTVEWSESRYADIVQKLGAFLRQAGFKDADVAYVPCSGITGDNLVEASSEPRLGVWYQGACLVEQIDRLRPPERPIIDKPLRLCVTDVFKSTGAGFSVAGTVQSGSVQAGDRVLAIPAGEAGLVKGVTVDDSQVSVGFAGDSVIVNLTGIDVTNISIGSVLCDPLNPVETTTRLRARIVIFNIDRPITKGFAVVLHYQALTEQAYVRRLISQLHRSTGDVIKKKPRCLVKNTSAVVELELARPVSLELYKTNKDLGRFMLRAGGATIAAGMVIEILSSKPTAQEATTA